MNGSQKTRTVVRGERSDMSKVKEYEEKCLQELYTELDEQQEHRQREYDVMQEALAQIQDVLNSDRSDWGKTVIISHIIKQLKGVL